MSFEKIRDNTVLVQCTFHLPSSTRQEKRTKVETEANKKLFRLQKKIFDCNEFHALERLHSTTIDWLKRRQVPGPFQRGFFLIPDSLLAEVLDKLDAVKVEHGRLVDKFVAAYGRIKEQAKVELADMYDERNYPSERYFRSASWIETQTLEFDLPNSGKVGDAISQAERQKAKSRWEEASREVTYALREQFQELITHLVERLEPNPDGKRKRLHESALVKVTEWMDLFRNRNVLGDAEMERLVEGAKRVIAGKDVEAIRDNDQLRGRMAAEMTKVREQLDVLIVDAPARRIRFDE